MATRPNREWIAEKLRFLMQHSDDLVGLSEGTVNEYRPLTALKLFVLAAGVDVFSKIVPPRYDHSYYFDLFAGSGVTRLRGRQESIVGSPILAPVMAHNHFREYHFVECKSKKADALRARLDYMTSVSDFPRDRCYVHEMDANDFVHEFLDDLRQDTPGYYRGVNIFTFVDPQGLDLEWGATERLANLYGDMLINFPKIGANRSVGSEKARRFYGTDEYEHLRSETARRKFYEDRLLACRNTDFTIPIRVNSGTSAKHFHYDLIYTTRRTEEDSPYLPAMEDMKTKIEVLDGDDIDRVLETLSGQLDAVGELLGDEEKTPEKQSTWKDYD